MTNQCQHGQLARVCLTCEQAAEIAQLREYLDAAQRRGEELRAQVAALTENGPPMQRGTTIEGTPWMGTMREVLEDYKSAADTEARWGDEARAEVAGLRESIAESLRLLGTDPKSARAVLLDAVRVDSRTLQAQGAGLESTYDVKVAPVVHYSYRCYSCDTRWECRTESADCPLCGTTNFPCAPGDAA